MLRGGGDGGSRRDPRVEPDKRCARQCDKRSKRYVAKQLAIDHFELQSTRGHVRALDASTLAAEQSSNCCTGETTVGLAARLARR